MNELKTSSFQLPDAERVTVKIIRLPGGKTVARTADELIARPTPPAPPDGSSPR